MKNLFVYCLFFLTIDLPAQIFEHPYSTSKIADSLRKNATIVIRKQNIEYLVKDIGHSVETEHHVVTLLKAGESSNRYITVLIGYDPLHKIRDLEAFIYDANGKLVQQLKKKDITDQKPLEEGIDDARYKVLNFPRLAFPYTIEYKVVHESEETMFYPHFTPQNQADVSVEDATLKVTVLAGHKLRYKELNMPKENNLSITGNTYSWRFQNIKAFQTPAFAPHPNTYLRSVITAPNDFAMGGYAGNMSSWEHYGNFMYRLNNGRLTLPAKTIDSLREVVKNCPDKLCMIEQLYTHLQNTTRYYSIQLGVGGWQTIPASDVNARKYGDCKALSNYMVSMLHAVGIKAYSADIRAMNATQYPDFPNAKFNHVIACVPLQSDTIWLECTSQYEPCGFLGSFTDNRLALLVTEDGGKPVFTPNYDEKVNIIRKNGVVILDSLGNATVTSQNQYAALGVETMAEIVRADAVTQKKIFYKKLSINQFNIEKLNYELHKTRIPILDEFFELAVEKLASVNGKRLFLPLNLFSVWDAVPSSDSTRQYEVQASHRGFTQIDSVYFQLPAGFKAESKYAPVVLENEFGSYEMKVTTVGNRILFFRKIILNNKILPKEKFTILNDFLRQIIKADKSKLVLVKS